MVGTLALVAFICSILGQGVGALPVKQPNYFFHSALRRSPWGPKPSFWLMSSRVLFEETLISSGSRLKSAGVERDGRAENNARDRSGADAVAPPRYPIAKFEHFCARALPSVAPHRLLGNTFAKTSIEESGVAHGKAPGIWCIRAPAPAGPPSDAQDSAQDLGALVGPGNAPVRSPSIAHEKSADAELGRGIALPVAASCEAIAPSGKCVGSPLAASRTAGAYVNAREGGGAPARGTHKSFPRRSSGAPMRSFASSAERAPAARPAQVARCEPVNTADEELDGQCIAAPARAPGRGSGDIRSVLDHEYGDAPGHGSGSVPVMPPMNAQVNAPTTEKGNKGGENVPRTREEILRRAHAV